MHIALCQRGKASISRFLAISGERGECVLGEGRSEKLEVVMPLYEYICKNCHHTFDEVMTVHERETKVRCPKCESPQVEKVIEQLL